VDFVDGEGFGQFYYYFYTNLWTSIEFGAPGPNSQPAAAAANRRSDSLKAPSKSKLVKMLLKPTVLATFWRALSEKGPERLNGRPWEKVTSSKCCLNQWF